MSVKNLVLPHTRFICTDDDLNIVRWLLFFRTNIFTPRQALMSSSWKQQGGIDGDAAGDLLGTSVALSANASIMAIGAWGFNTDTGYVKVFRTKFEGGNRVQLGEPPLVMTRIMISETILILPLTAFP